MVVEVEADESCRGLDRQRELGEVRMLQLGSRYC